MTKWFSFLAGCSLICDKMDVGHADMVDMFTNTNRTEDFVIYCDMLSVIKSTYTVT